MTPQRQLRILTVDDEPGTDQADRALVAPDGHLVTIANSGEEGLEQLAKPLFDLVLSDVGMSGWDLAELVRADWLDVRFVLATGWGAGAIPPKHAPKVWPRCWPNPTSGADFVMASAFQTRRTISTSWLVENIHAASGF